MFSRSVISRSTGLEGKSNSGEFQRFLLFLFFKQICRFRSALNARAETNLSSRHVMFDSVQIRSDPAYILMDIGSLGGLRLYLGGRMGSIA